MPVRPLTRRTKDGRALTRSNVVEAQIAEVLALEARELRQRVAVSDRADCQYVKEETLVHLLREYHRRGDGEVCNALAEELVRRCVPPATKYLGSLGADEFSAAYDDLMGRLFEKILDLSEGSGDFFEVRFGMQFKRFAIDTFRAHTADVKKAAATQVSLSSLAGYDDNADDDGHSHRFLPQTQDGSITAPQLVLAKEALARISEPERTAFLLYHWTGWPIESKDPRTPSISKYFDKTPRTIQNWLNTAEKALETWRGEQP